MNGEPDGNPVVGTKTVKVIVNTVTGSVVLDPQAMTLSAKGEKLTYKLSFVAGSPGQADVRACITLLKKNRLLPTAGTANDGYQDFAYAITDKNGNHLDPTFVAEADGEVRVLVTVMFPEGSSHAYKTDESVVIMDW